MRGKVQAQCVSCRAELQVVLRNVHDTRFGIEGSFDICRCTSCGLEQTIPIQTSKELTELYGIYYNFGGETGSIYTSLREGLFASNLYRMWTCIDGDVAFQGQTGSGHLLDIGCNEGRGLEFFHRSGFDVEGLELNEAAASAAKAKRFVVHTVPLEQFNPAEPYDVAVLSNVLEHSLDPKGMLFHIRRILRPGGQVWISCPNKQSWLRFTFRRSWINWHVPFHIVHFSSLTLTRLLQESGFKVVHLKQETPALWVAHSIIARLFARCGKPTTQLRNPFLVGLLMLLIRGLFFPFLWIGNRTGHGDCLVIVATTT